MEYSKEDLMEAKKQILGVGENMGTEESKKIWEKNAQFYRDFVSMIDSLKQDVAKLRTLTINSDMNALMKKMFGETVTNEAIMEYAKKMNENRSEGVLSVDSAGRLNTKGVGASVRKNTFYGE